MKSLTKIIISLSNEDLKACFSNKEIVKIIKTLYMYSDSNDIVELTNRISSIKINKTFNHIYNAKKYNEGS